MSQTRETSFLLPANAERRQLTVMFCDLVDATRLASSLDTETFRELIVAYNSQIAATVNEFGGIVARYLGDGALIYFGYPVATEADVEHAIRAGLCLIERVRKIESEHEIQLRVGIATGEVIIGDDSGLGSAGKDSAIGESLYLADRLQKFAEPNTLVVCAATHNRAGTLFDFLALGSVELKGLPTVSAWRVLDQVRNDSRFEALRLSRGLSPFVGRDSELEALERSIHERNHDVLFIDIAGEPGIGKSRLLHEFKNEIERYHALALAGSCSPDGQQTVFLPFIEVVRRSCQLSIGEDKDRVREKLRMALACLNLESNLNVALLLNLLGLVPPSGSFDGLDPALIGMRTRDLLLQLLRARSQASPLILLLEDLHWIDSASEELLDRIAAEPDLTLLVITTRRLAYDPPWLSRANIVRLPLNPLPASQTKRIILNWLGPANASESIVSLVAEKAEGNPLFAEEMARFVADGGVFSSGSASPPASTKLPESIQSLLMSRVDQLALSPADRSILQTAAIVGRRFDADLIAALTGITDCEKHLASLEAVGILRRSEGRFLFKHALLRDVLYASILVSRRSSLHAAVANEIERRSGDRLVEVAEVLAHHYSQTDLAAKTVAFLTIAGGKSFGVYSLEEANQYFGRALKVVEVSPAAIDRQQIGELVAAYLQVLGLQAKYSEATAVFENYHKELEQLDDKKPFVLALNSTCFAYFMQLQLDNARRMATRALEISDQVPDDRTRAYAVSALVFSQPATRMLPEGKFESLAADAVERSLRADDGFIQVRLLFDLAWYHLSRGAFVEGRQCAVELMRVGRMRNDSRAIGFANWTFGLHYVCEGSYEEALVHSQMALDVSLTTWDREGALWVKAGALALSRRVDEARVALSELTQLCVSSNDRVSLTSAELFYGVVLIMEGRFARGVRRITNCIKSAEAAGWMSLADWARTNLAEVYLEFLAPSQKIGLWIILRNLPFLLMVRILAARRACNLLNWALNNDWFSQGGYFRARMHFDLGRVLRIRRKVTLAWRHCEMARKIASELGNERLLKEIENEFAKLR